MTRFVVITEEEVDKRFIYRTERDPNIITCRSCGVVTYSGYLVHIRDCDYVWLKRKMRK